MDAGPCWCFDRFGQSSTVLADGRTVLIAGEHEDHYDPDFYIYNDVVVVHPDGGIEIFGYPREIFPPTDFHSATLVGKNIVIIGNLGYPHDRRPATTPVFLLDIETLAISAVQTCGTPPGWIHEHEACLSDHGAAIVIQRGVLDRGDPDTSLVENIDDWRLTLGDWKWQRLTECRWQRWEFRRQDRTANHLWQIQQARWSRDVRQHEPFEEQMEELEHELGARPDIDVAARLYRPGVAHEQLQEIENEYGIVRIRVADVVVRYVEDIYSVQMTVEGDLSESVIDSLIADLRQKLATLENTPCEAKQL